MSVHDLTFAGMNPAHPTTKDERLDLLPEPSTIGFSHFGARCVIRSKSRRSETIAPSDLVGACFGVSPRSSLLSQVGESFAAVAVLDAVAAGSFAEFVQEWRKYDCSGIKVMTHCLPMFKSTMKTISPFLPRQGIAIHPEIREHMNEDQHLRRIIDMSVIELSNALEDEDSYFLDVFEESDVDVPRWNENVIRVRIGTVSFENKIKLWENLEERVRSKIEEIRRQLPPNKRRKIDAVNESLSIRLETEDI